MKKIKLLVSVMLISTLAVTFVSCSKSSSNSVSKGISNDANASNVSTEGTDPVEIEDVGSKTVTENSNKSYSADDTWAIYWYLCGSDLESGGGAATADMAEMLQVILPENVKVIIQTGGASAWKNDFVNATKTQRYLYSGDKLELVDEEEQANMGDAATLQGFLSFCEEQYPADHKMVLFWNHGGGSVGGAAYDENYGHDSLSLSEMNQAFNAVYGEQETPLELVGFDTCLMSTLDTASVFKNYASYLVASEELEPGNGWYYSGWLAALANNPGMTGADLGTAICDTYVTGCEEVGTQDEITLAVTDLGKLDTLLTAFNGMGKEILSSAITTPSVCGEFARSAEKSENYGGNNDKEGYTNMVDLGDLVSNAKNLLPGTAQQVLSALDEVIVYRVNGTYRQYATGLSVYYSYNGDKDNLAQYDEVAADSIYPSFIHYSIGDEITEDVVTDLEDIDYEDVEAIEKFNGSMPVEITDQNYARLSIAPENLDSVKSVFFNLAYYSEEDDVILFLGMDNDLNVDWENGIFEDNFRGVWGALDENLCYMEITYEGEDYNLYSVPIYLNGVECFMTVAYDYTTSSYEILGARENIEDDTTMGDKNLIKLKAGDEVIPILYAMAISGDSEEVTEVPSDPIILTESSSFAEMELGDGKFAFMFEVVDTSNTTYDSDVALFDYAEGVVNYIQE